MVHMDYRMSKTRAAMHVEAARRQAEARRLALEAGAGEQGWLLRQGRRLLSRLGFVLIVLGRRLQHCGPVGPATLERAEVLGRR
jgi:hypothetical protein